MRDRLRQLMVCPAVLVGSAARRQHAHLPCGAEGGRDICEAPVSRHRELTHYRRLKLNHPVFARSVEIGIWALRHGAPGSVSGGGQGPTPIPLLDGAFA